MKGIRLGFCQALGAVSAAALLVVASSSVSAQDGSVDPIDCSGSLGLVQMFFSVETRTATAKQLVLDSDAGSTGASNNYADFSPAWTVSLDVPGDDDLKELNGTSINPVDGKAYAAVRSDAGLEYLVRFDRDGDLEFLLEYSATTTNNGTFDSQGRFYSAASVGGSAVVQRWDNLDQVAGSADPASVTVRAADNTGPLVTNVPADLSAITVGGVEYIVGVPNGTADVLMVFNTETLTSTSFDASSSLNRTGGTGLPTGGGYGAAWSFEGISYLAQNNGGGLWSLLPDDIDVGSETATLRQVLQATQSTQSNDGFGCPTESLLEDTELPGAAGAAHLVYHANGGTGDPDDLQTPPEENVTLSSQEPTRDGYIFMGWDTEPSGDGTGYSPSDPFVMPGDGETSHLYAQWQPVTTTTTAAPTTTTAAPTTTTAAPTTTTPAVIPPTSPPAEPTPEPPTYTG